MKHTFHPHAEKELEEIVITTIMMRNWEIDFVKRFILPFHESLSSQMPGSKG